MEAEKMLAELNECPAVKYAEWCIAEENDKAPIYVKKQCRKWLNIVAGKDDEAYIDLKKYGTICKLLRLIIHPDLGKPLYACMERYAWLMIIAAFCTRRRTDGTRYYQTVLLEICRKNYKTFYSAVCFVIGMLTEPKFSRFFSVAPDLKLSKELQVALRKLIKSSPALSDGTVFKVLRSEIRCALTDSEYTPLAYSEDKLDGKLAHIFLADEAGAMDDYPVEAMRSSQITLRDKLGIIISTQYPNDNNVLLTEIDIAKKSLDDAPDGKKRYFALLYEPDDWLLKNEQWQTNDLITYQSNPVAVDNPYIFEDLCDKRATAVLYESKRENYLCKHCNIRFKSLGVESYVPIDLVRQCKVVEDAEFWRGKRVYLGLDLSMTEDNTALAMVCEVDGVLYAKVWGFIPAYSVELKSKKENLDYKRFFRLGYCFPCGDRVIDYSFVEAFILSIPQRYGVDILSLGFDKYNAMSTVQKLEAAENPIECVEIKQHSSLLHAPTKLLKERILHGTFRYDENELLESGFENARCTEDTNLNKYVNKKKSAGKVDTVVAVINAVFLLQQEQLSNVGWGAQVF